MAVHKMSSTDAGAPTFSSTTGQAVTFFDAVLVNGYNSKTVTITRSGAVATASCTSHGFVDGARINHAGANESEYNITEAITVTGADTYTYPVSGTPNSPATGTITAKVAPLGWAKEFSGSNKAAYRPPAGLRARLRVDHTGTTSIYLRGYMAMTDVDTGTDPFPTVAQHTNGPGMYANNSTGKDWFLIGDDKRFTLWWDAVAASNASVGTNANVMGFGDLSPSFKAGDAYHAFLAAQNAAGQSDNGGISYCSPWTALAGTFICRSYTQAGGSVTAGKSTPWPGITSSTVYTGGSSYGIAYPNGPNGGLYIAPTYLHEAATGHLRGVWPGVWFLGHAYTNFGQRDTFTGTGDLAGKKFIILKMGVGGSPNGAIVLETSNTWS